MKFGLLWWPNSWLKMLTQVNPHDGVAALAAAAVPSTPAVPTPPIMASVAAVARTLLLMDMKQFLSWNSHSRALRTAVAGARGRFPADSRLPDQDVPGRLWLPVSCFTPDSEDARVGRVVDNHHLIYTLRN